MTGGTGMQKNPRDAVVAAAQAQLAITVANIVETYELSYGELQRIISNVQSPWIRFQNEPNCALPHTPNTDV